MLFKTAAKFAWISGLMILSGPAMAGTQSDIQACRAAITQAGTYDLSDHRLRYMSKKGNRLRTLTLKAIPAKGGESFIIKCQLNRKNLVVVINDQSTAKLVSRD